MPAGNEKKMGRTQFVMIPLLTTPGVYSGFSVRWSTLQDFTAGLVKLHGKCHGITQFTHVS